MSSTGFQVDFESDTPEFTEEYKDAAEMRLCNIADSYTDIHHAVVAVTKSQEGEEPAKFQARVMVDSQPDNIEVTKKDYAVVEALDEALGEIEQDIRKRYDDSSEGNGLLSNPT